MKRDTFDDEIVNEGTRQCVWSVYGSEREREHEMGKKSKFFLLHKPTIHHDISLMIVHYIFMHIDIHTVLLSSETRKNAVFNEAYDESRRFALLIKAQETNRRNLSTLRRFRQTDFVVVVVFVSVAFH